MNEINKKHRNMGSNEGFEKSDKTQIDKSKEIQLNTAPVIVIEPSESNLSFHQTNRSKRQKSGEQSSEVSKCKWIVGGSSGSDLESSSFLNDSLVASNAMNVSTYMKKSNGFSETQIVRLT